MWQTRTNNRIQVFDSNGNFITKFGTPGTGNGQFNQPVGVAVNPITGNVYVADAGNDRIQVFDSTGNFIINGDLLAPATASLIMR